MLNPSIGAVILDVDLNLSFPKLYEAAMHLRRPDVIFITGATDRNVPIGSDLVFMGNQFSFYLQGFSKSNMLKLN